MLTLALQKVGVATDGITSHSIRKGGATLLTKSGVKVPALKEHGTWASDAYLGYIQFNMEDKFKVTQQAYKYLTLWQSFSSVFTDGHSSVFYRLVVAKLEYSIDLWYRGGVDYRLVALKWVYSRDLWFEGVELC